MRQRLAILITLILTGQIAFGQTYSSLITDKEIYDFLNWMTKTEKKYDEEPFLKRKHIYYKISPWEIANFVKADTLKNSPEFDFHFLFKKRGGSDTLFSSVERKYLYQQYLAIKDTVWHTKFKNSKLTRSKSQIRPNRYYYSVPLFSLNKKYVVIRKTYYCGRLCAYFGFYIYRKVGIKEWEYVTCVNCGMS